GLSSAAVKKLVESQIQGPDIGFLGQSRVNVLQLNIAHAALSSTSAKC
ncbi:MAG: K+-transporting ATPase, c chain, partial [Microbacteriaceae bacterium]|nr:K+-transporting ATPase, c chain [Microbacteriaceae bacterium]